MKKQTIPFMFIQFFLVALLSKSFAATPDLDIKSEVRKIILFQKSYSDLIWETDFDRKEIDWVMTVTIPGEKKSATFYWCHGRMLPPEELPNKEKYSPLLYKYEKNVRDPANYTEDEKQRLKDFSSSENRLNGPGTPMFFFDFLYDSYSRATIEPHIKRIKFLGKSTKVHERLVNVLKDVENSIIMTSLYDPAVQSFLKNIESADAFYWREIAGTNRKSFHSLGIAIDILPLKLSGKEIFWGWAQRHNPQGWMLTPLSNRWSPPQNVISIFEANGFIWGGKWAIWDNMHFEYHPELINYNFNF